MQNYKGELLRTDDSGESWLPVGGDAPRLFDAFTMVDNYLGWAVDNEAKVWKSEDGGRSWVSTSSLKREDPTESYMGASQIIFPEAGKGWIVDTFAVWRTWDAGASWREASELSFRELKNRVRQLHFVDARRGWAIGDGGLILRTGDGGESWHPIGDNLSFDEATTINGIHFLDEDRGWITVSDAPKPFPQNVVLATADGCKTWVRQKEFGGGVSVRDIFFLGRETGWMAGVKKSPKSEAESGVLFRTPDGGRTWQYANWPREADAFKSVHFTSSAEGWLVTDYSIYRTRDGGETWSTVLSYPEVKRRNLQLLGIEDKDGRTLTELRERALRH